MLYHTHKHTHTHNHIHALTHTDFNTFHTNIVFNRLNVTLDSAECQVQYVVQIQCSHVYQHLYTHRFNFIIYECKTAGRCQFSPVH